MERYRQAIAAVPEEAHRLGQSVGADPFGIDALWPELLGPKAAQARQFGEGFGQTAADLPDAWGILVRRFADVADTQRNPALLAGFLRAAMHRDDQLVASMLSEAVRSPILAPWFPYLQLTVGLDAAGIGRLVDAVERGAAPASAFRGLAGGKVTESILAADLFRLLRGIAQLPDGYAVATEILSMHFLGQPPSSGWDRSVIECGQNLLAQYPLEQAKDRESCDYASA